MQQIPKPNAFTQPRRASIAIELQRKAIKSHVPNAQQQIVFTPRLTPSSASASLERVVKETEMEVEYLVGERNKILVIEGHVDLEEARTAFISECDDPDWPYPQHAYMRYTKTPDDEFAENWRETCREKDKGAKPVTISVLDW